MRVDPAFLASMDQQHAAVTETLNGLLSGIRTGVAVNTEAGVSEAQLVYALTEHMKTDVEPASLPGLLAAALVRLASPGGGS